MKSTIKIRTNDDIDNPLCVPELVITYNGYADENHMATEDVLVKRLFEDIQAGCKFECELDDRMNTHTGCTTQVLKLTPSTKNKIRFSDDLKSTSFEVLNNFVAGKTPQEVREIAEYLYSLTAGFENIYATVATEATN